VNKKQEKQNTNIGPFELFKLKSLSIDEVKEKVPGLLNESGDEIDLDKLLEVFFNIIKETSLVANGNRWKIASSSR